MEADRIRQVYSKTDALGEERHVWSFFNLAYLFHMQSRDREVIRLLSSHGIRSLEDSVVLDVGCGTGAELRKFVLYGARPKHLFGIDLLDHRIKEAMMLNPAVNFQVVNGETLPFQDGTFDIILQFTCFSSVLCEDARQSVANEMIRVLKPTGIILWFDMRTVPLSVRMVSWFGRLLSEVCRNVARGADGHHAGQIPTKPLDLDDVRRLFPRCRLSARTVSLHFPWGGVARYGWWLGGLLQAVPCFRTHLLIGITKERGT